MDNSIHLSNAQKKIVRSIFLLNKGNVYDIVRHSGLNKGTVSAYLSKLLQMKQIRVAGYKNSCKVYAITHFKPPEIWRRVNELTKELHQAKITINRLRKEIEELKNCGKE